jgi:TPR repeat protein
MEPEGSQKDFENLKKWAERGRVWACLALGDHYRTGRGVIPRSDSEFQRFMQIAAKRGQPVAQHNLGKYLHEQSSVQDQKKGFQWLSKAALSGIPMSMFYVGMCYEKGLGVPPSSAKAAKWYRKAAEHDVPDAIYNLGLYHEKGKPGTPQSFAKAAELYKRASDLGDIAGTYNLAGLLARNLGNPEEACRLNKIIVSNKSALIDFRVRSHNRLGHAYLIGEGVGRSLPEAAKHYRFAAQHGHSEAKTMLAYVMKMQGVDGAPLATTSKITQDFIELQKGMPEPPKLSAPHVQHKLPSQCPPAGSAAPGSRWIIHGLMKNAHLNGKVVTLFGHHRKSGKAVVEIDAVKEQRGKKSRQCKIGYDHLAPLDGTASGSV